MSAPNDDRPCVLYFGNDWFADNRTSSHHIARWLSRRYRVFYIECPGLRAPKTSGRDFKRIFGKVGRFLKGARPVPEGVKVRTLLQIPLHRFALMRALNRGLILATLKWLMWREGVKQPITWFMVPHLSNVVGRLGERLSVYYCIDDYATLPDVDQVAVQNMDDELARKADLVFVSAESLLEHKLTLNKNSHFSPHGVDLDLFTRGLDPNLACPADIAGLPRPIVGFFGLIERWIDLELIGYLAQQRPNVTFLMVGRVAVPDDELPKAPNLHWIGQRPYGEMPAYGKQFDVAIIPFLITPVIWHANPIKLREYLALGKRIVSVSTPEIDRYADVVELAHSREEWLQKLDGLLAQPQTPESVQHQAARVAPESWQGRLEEVHGIVLQNLEAKARGQKVNGV